jgi:hypothetical protein
VTPSLGVLYRATMSGRGWVLRIIVGIALVGLFSVALVDRLQHDASTWRIVSAVLLIGLGAMQIVNGIRDRRRAASGESPDQPRL